MNKLHTLLKKREVVSLYTIFWKFVEGSVFEKVKRGIDGGIVGDRVNMSVTQERYMSFRLSMRKYFWGMGFLGGLLLIGASFLFFSPSKTMRVLESTKAVERSFESEGTGDVSLDERGGAKEVSLKIFFAGDMMFDRYIRTQSDKIGKEAVFEGLAGELRAADFFCREFGGPDYLKFLKECRVGRGGITAFFVHV